MFFIRIFLISTLIFSQSPWEDLVNPTNISGVFQGQATFNGNPASGEDWIAAFDEGGNCAGANQIVISNSIVYINLVIYGDDPTSTDVDEGINGGEAFILKLWLSSLDTILEFPDPFYCWHNNNGAPMTGCGDVNTVYNFVNEELSLNDQWIPDKVSLNQNYPNPFNIETALSFIMQNSAMVSLDIFNINGIKVKQIFRGNLDSGHYSVRWNGENDKGAILPSGLYFYTLSYTQDDITKSFTKKMELIK